MIRGALFLLLAFFSHSALAAQVENLKITVLSTMLTDVRGTGEWGYAAVVEADGRSILFDTGAKPETVLANARELGVDLSRVEEVVISHNHWDHTGGLVTLRRELMKSNPKALSRAHIAEGIFLSRPGPDGERNGLLRERAAYENLGGTFIIHDKPVELAPGVWFSGPVPRVHNETNYPADGRLEYGGHERLDTIPEDAALVADMPDGLVLLTGCGHAGIVNIAEHARQFVREAPLEAVLGGIHLFNASSQTIDWTARKLAEFGLKHFLAGHCTGLEPTWRIRQLTALARDDVAYGAVGATYSTGSGIDPRPIAR